MNKKMFRKYTLRSLVTLGLCSLLFTQGIQASEGPAKVSEEPIAPGVIHESYRWATNYGSILFEVLECDLTNPNVDIRLVAGQGEYGKKATVPAMAQKTNATAMLNGDFFNMALEGAPIGPSIINGQLASSPAVIKEIYSLGITADNTASIEAMTYNGCVTAADGATFPIDGLNKTYYWHDPSGTESHTNLIQMYNDLWGSSSRGHATNTEVLLNEQGIVEKISVGKTFPFPVPDGKIILQVNGKAEVFIKQHCPIGSKVSIFSQVTPDRDWKFLVGGHALLMDQGKVVPYSKDFNTLAGVRARTAAGVSQDGKTLWLVCAEGRTNRSVGAHLSTLSYFMQNLGAYRAVNLDGGGSTNMVLKHYGANKLSTVVAPEGNGWLRPVVNGIGIYDTAPVGPIEKIEMTASDTVVVGETVYFKVKRAMDANYHPIPVKENEFILSSVNGLGASNGLYYVALKPGVDTVQITHKTGVSEQHTLTIQGEEGLKELHIKPDQFMVDNGSSVKAALYGTKKNNQTIMLDPRVATWSLEGFTGLADTGTISITNTENLANGKIVAQIGSLKAETLLGNNAYNLLDLYIDNKTYWLNGMAHTLDQPPIIKNDRTLVPIRLITEALGGEVEWEDNKKPIIIKYKEHQLEFLLNSRDVIVDGVSTTTDLAPQIINNRTVVPIRFISENLDMDILFDDATRCVSICGLK